MTRFAGLLASSLVLASLTAGCGPDPTISVWLGVTADGDSDAPDKAAVTFSSQVVEAECGVNDCELLPVSTKNVAIKVGPPGALFNLDYDEALSALEVSIWGGAMLGYPASLETVATVDGETSTARIVCPLWPKASPVSPAREGQALPIRWTPVIDSNPFVQVRVKELSTNATLYERVSQEKPDDGFELLPAEAFPAAGDYEIELEERTFPDAESTSGAAHFAHGFTISTRTTITIAP